MAKRTPLVCQHLENISREALEQHQEMVRQYVRRRHGVYALYRRGKLYYVGLAANLRTRLGHHLKDRHHDSWDRFSVYLIIGDSHLRELESLIIRVVNPPGNRQRGRFAKSEDLSRRFERDWFARMRLKLGEFLGRKSKVTAGKARVVLVNGRKPVLADYVTKSMTLRARYKGKTLKAFVLRSGIIRYGGKRFASPSLAGAYAMKQPTCNGWRFWQYERAPGDWVLLNRLKR